MKQFIPIILCLLFFLPATTGAVSASRQAEGSEATVCFLTEESDRPIFFQPESDQVKGYRQVKPGQTLTVSLEHKAAYYYYVDRRSHFHSVFLTPGSTTRIVEKEGEVSFEGDHADINRFMQTHPSVVRIPRDIALYSDQWLAYQRQTLQQKSKELAQAGLPDLFVRAHTLYYRCEYLRQLAQGPATMRMFQGQELKLADGFYDDLKQNRYDDADLLLYPKWFTLMRCDMELREQQGDIITHPRRFLAQYAACIAHPEVKAAFLIRSLQQILAAGYAEDFPEYLSSAREAMGDVAGPEFDESLQALQQQHAALQVRYAGISRGKAAPSFAGKDVNGRSYSSDDYRGKVWVLDFWFSGCVPCKAEMPYMEQLARELKGKDIQFFCLSLDSGTVLMKAWESLVREKQGEILHLNIPDGFKSALAAHYGIRSVPRIVIVDQQGRIVDAFARRPSDPKLRRQLLELLHLSDEASSLSSAGDSLLTPQSASAALARLTAAGDALQKEAIMKEFVQQVRRQQASFAYATANMMLSLTVEALYAEGHTAKADQYMERLQPSPFKRDLLFMSGARCHESHRPETALRLMGEAVQMTQQLNGDKEPSEEETKKYPVMFGLYAEALVADGQTEAAVPYAALAYRHSNGQDFRLNRTYAATLIHQHRYEEAAPLVESFISQGKSDPQHIAWLKETYVHLRGSDDGFEGYVTRLQENGGQALREKLAQAATDEPAPLFTLTGLHGERVSLEALQGKTVVLDFWATWCGPCKASFPAMQQVVDHYRDCPDVVFLFIHTLENRPTLQADVEHYLQKQGYTFQVLFDRQDPLTRQYPVIGQYGAKGIPAKYVIDPKGHIRYKLSGYSGSDEETVGELKSMIDFLRAEE